MRWCGCGLALCFAMAGWTLLPMPEPVVNAALPDETAAPPAAVAKAANRLPAGDVVRLPVTRDTWFSNVGEEADDNLGASTRLKLKSHQEMSLVDMDATPLKGRTILAATLHVKVSGNERLNRVTVSSFASEWIEGTSPRYAVQNGSSSHRFRVHPSGPWAEPGSDLTAVTLGNGHTRWAMADAFPPDKDGWQRIAVEPAIVALRAAGVSHGFLLYDDTGTEWSRNGTTVTFRHMPNRFVDSREAGADRAPYFTVVLGKPDDRPPEACGPIQVDPATAGLPAGEALVSWVTPPDSGTGTVGFLVEVDGRPVPRYLIPLAAAGKSRVQMHLRDLGLAAGTTVPLSVRAVDGAGNVGPETTARIAVSKLTGGVDFVPGVDPTPFRSVGPLPKLGEAEIAIIDGLDKVHPLTGELIPTQPPGYLLGNHLWMARDRELRLHAARNEFVSFQVLVRGKVQGLKPELVLPLPGAGVTFSRARHVTTPRGPLPDPLLPLTGPFNLPEDAAAAKESTTKSTEIVEGQKAGSIYCEIYIPHQTPPGEYPCVLKLTAGAQKLELPVKLTVWDFTLPDTLSFLPEMNCYSLPGNEGDYYRLAHRHRTVVNRVPYSQRGEIDAGCAPSIKGESFDWTAWDARFGPFLDGTAFSDLPRKGVPLECFYLPLHENWPTPIDPNYNGNYWADRAFPPEYRQKFVEAAEQFARHLSDKDFNRTMFHGYLNNKNNFKENGWNRGSAPWILDEPASFQDFWALRYFGDAFQEGIARGLSRAKSPARIVFRADISRPQWQRDSLDSLLNYNVVSGGSFREYHRLVIDRKHRFGQVVVDYGTTNAIEESNVQPAGWCVNSWTLESDGVVPWQTIGTADSWKKGDALSLFYPGAFVGQKEPIASVRLKAYLRGQQDVEYYTLLMQTLQQPRWLVGQELRRLLNLSAQVKGTGVTNAEDAGRVEFTQLRPQDLWRVRVRIGNELSRRHAAAPPRELVPRVPTGATPLGGSVTVGEIPDPASQVEVPTASTTPETSVAAKHRTLILQGPKQVVDALIDPQTPDMNVGGEPRDNRLSRREVVNAFLVRFDLASLKLAPKAKIVRARLGFSVWDPSSQGTTKVAAFPVLQEWDATTVTWKQASAGKPWHNPSGFSFAEDAGKTSPPIHVPPEPLSDTVDPPRESLLDVTVIVRHWHAGQSKNFGFAVAPVIDRTVDEGNFTRMQILASESPRVEFTPRLLIDVEE